MLWWYLVENSKNNKKVKKYLDQLLLDLNNIFYVNEFVIIELMHLLIKKSKEGYEIAKELLSDQYPFLKIIYDFSGRSSLKKILETLNTYGYSSTIGGRDSSIIVTMQTHQIVDIISNDNGFKSVKNISIHNPIK